MASVTPQSHALDARPQTNRVVSIDVFRGLTMLLMLFVNDIGDVDLGNLQNAPWWLKHMPAGIDGMTMADVIMPCFLFIVGLAIPIALEGRIARGDSVLKISWHIIARTAALVFIGLCMVNSCHGGVRLDEASMGMSEAWWRILTFLSIIVFWNRYPQSCGLKRGMFLALRVLAAGSLIYLLAIYRADQNGATVWLQSRWWGIIGLIGWAYLIAALVWLACRNYAAAVMGAFGLLVALNIGLRSDVLPCWNRMIEATHGWLPGLQLGTYASMAVAGMAVATLFLPNSPATTPGRRIAWTLVFGSGFAAAALLLRPLWGIHKADATPAWVLGSLAVACAAYAFLYWLVNVKKFVRWTTLIAPAGSNTLLMYLLPYIFYSALAVLGIDYLQTHFNEGWPGVARSAVFAFAMVGVTGLLTHCKIRLRV